VGHVRGEEKNACAGSGPKGVGVGESGEVTPSSHMRMAEEIPRVFKGGTNGSWNQVPSSGPAGG